MPVKKKAKIVPAAGKYVLADTTSVLARLRAQITAHKAFGPNYADSGPEKLTQTIRSTGIGGTHPAFCKETFVKELKRVGSYTCEGNLFGVSDGSTGIPVRQTALTDAMRLNFPEPRPITEPIVIAVPNPDFNPLQHKESLKAVSPEEDRLMVLKAVVRDLEDAEKMKEWAGYLRVAPLKFELLQSKEDQHFRDVAIRESVVSRHALVSRTSYGRMLEVWNFKVAFEVDLGKIPASALAEKCPPYIQTHVSVSPTLPHTSAL